MTRPYTRLCISFYDDDLDRLDDQVAKLKAAGYTKVNRSMLLRVAMAVFDPSLLAVELQDHLKRYPKVRRKPRGQYTCTECAQPGHNSQTCPNGERVEPSALMEGV